MEVGREGGREGKARRKVWKGVSGGAHGKDGIKLSSGLQEKKEEN